MDAKLSLRRVMSLGSAPLARYLAPLLSQDASSLFRDSYLKTILSSLVDDPGLPLTVRLAAGDLRGAITMAAADSMGADLECLAVRRAVVLRETLDRYAGFQDSGTSAALPTPSENSSNGDSAQIPVVVWIPHVRSPFNVGNIIRTCAGFGVAGVVLGEAVPELTHPRLRRAAMGATAMVPVVRGGRHEAEALLGATRVQLVGLETGGAEITRFAFPERGIMVLGHEELGIPESILKQCQDEGKVVTIPHGGPKSSLNVGVAAGICLSWWQAQGAKG